MASVGVLAVHSRGTAQKKGRARTCTTGMPRRDAPAASGESGCGAAGAENGVVAACASAEGGTSGSCGGCGRPSRQRPGGLPAARCPARLDP